MFSDSIEIFHGTLSPVEAQLYVRVADLPGAAPYAMRGSLHGPKSQVGRTLPATSPLMPMPAGPTLLGRFVVSEPSFWSPAMPSLYDLRLEVLRGGEQLCSLQCEVGFRSLGATGRDLRFEQRRWVLRGAQLRAPVDTSSWIDARLAVVVTDPSAGFCAAAGRDGLLTVAYVRSGGAERLRRLRTLQRSPAVAAVVLTEAVADEQEVQQAAGNLLLGERCPSGAPLRPADWADLIFYEFEEARSRVGEAAECQRPVVVVREVGRELDAVSTRAECDRLQRDLVRLGNFAGYVISLPSGNS